VFVVVPNYVRDAINERMEMSFIKYPLLKAHREEIFNDILAYYDKFGKIPDFEIQPKDSACTNQSTATPKKK